MISRCAVASLFAASALACERGCGIEAPAEESLFEASAAAPEAAAAPASRRVHRSGLIGMVFYAAHELKLSPAEISEIDDIEAALPAGDARVRAERGKFEADLVAGIRAGLVDLKQTQADFSAIDWAMQSRQDQQAEAMNALHAELAAEQRHEVSYAVRARRAAHALRPPDESPDTDAQWTKQRLDRLVAEVGLDAAQRPKVAALLAKGDLPTPEEVQGRKDAAGRRADAMLVAFESDMFDAKTYDPPATDPPPHDFTEREVRFLSRLLPLLRPDQREKLAVMRERPRRTQGEGEEP